MSRQSKTHSLVVGVHQDDLVVLVHTILVNPIRVEHPQVSTPPSNTLLGGTPQAALVLEVVDTLADGLAVGGTLGDGLLAVTPADTDAVDDVALLGLVAEAAGLVGARWAGGAVDDVQLAVFPAPAGQRQSTSVFHLQWPYTHLTRRRKRRTSDCFFL